MCVWKFIFSSSEFASPFIFYVSIKVLNFLFRDLYIFGLLRGTFGFDAIVKMVFAVTF